MAHGLAGHIVVLVAEENRPTGGADATATPTNLATPFSFPAPTIQAGALVTPSQLATNFSFPGATITAGATVVVTRLQTPFSFPASTITAGATVTPSRLQTPFSFPASSISVCDVTDDFTRANGNIGSNYETMPNDSIPQISSNTIVVTPVDFAGSIRTAEAYGPTQSSALTITAPSSGSWYAQVCARAETSRGDGYYFKWSNDSSGQYFLYAQVNGVQTTIGSILTGQGTTGTKRLTVEANGTTITGYVDGISTITGTDSSIANGNPGFDLFTLNNTLTADSFCANGVLTGGSQVRPGVLSTPFTFPAPTISVGGSTTATPSALSTPFSFPSATVTAAATVTPSNLSTPFTFPAPTLSMGATVVPSNLATPFTVRVPTILAGATATFTQLSTPFSFPAPTIVISNPDVTVSAPRLQTPFTFPAPSASTPTVNVDGAGIHVPFRVIRRRRRRR